MDATEVLIPGVTAFIGSTAGVLVGWRIQRGQERRDMRRPVYVEWLKVARALVGPPGPGPGGGAIQLPTPEMKTRLNDLTTEVELVASARVASAVNSYLHHLNDPAVATAMARPAKTMDEMVDRFQKLMFDHRKRVVAEMRRDLGAGRPGNHTLVIRVGAVC